MAKEKKYGNTLIWGCPGTSYGIFSMNLTVISRKKLELYDLAPSAIELNMKGVQFTK